MIAIDENTTTNEYSVRRVSDGTILLITDDLLAALTLAPLAFMLERTADLSPFATMYENFGVSALPMETRGSFVRPVSRIFHAYRFADGRVQLQPHKADDMVDYNICQVWDEVMDAFNIIEQTVKCLLWMEGKFDPFVPRSQNWTHDVSMLLAQLEPGEQDFVTAHITSLLQRDEFAGLNIDVTKFIGSMNNSASIEWRYSLLTGVDGLNTMAFPTLMMEFAWGLILLLLFRVGAFNRVPPALTEEPQ